MDFSEECFTLDPKSRLATLLLLIHHKVSPAVASVHRLGFMFAGCNYTASYIDHIQHLNYSPYFSTA